MEWFWLALGIAILVLELVTTKLYCASISLSAFLTAVAKLIANEIKQPFGLKWQLLFFICLATMLLSITFTVKFLISKRKK